MPPWSDVRDRIERRTDRVLADLREEWGPAAAAGQFDLGPRPWDPDEPPGSVDRQLETFGGVASVVVFYTREREEAVLVYNRAGYWEPPGDVVEPGWSPAETAVREAREETGLDVELADLPYAGRVRSGTPTAGRRRCRRRRSSATASAAGSASNGRKTTTPASRGAWGCSAATSCPRTAGTATGYGR